MRMWLTWRRKQSPLFCLLLLLLASMSSTVPMHAADAVLCNRTGSQQVVLAHYATDVVENEYIVKFKHYYNEDARSRYISAALRASGLGTWKVLPRQNAATEYPSDFDIVQAAAEPVPGPSHTGSAPSVSSDAAKWEDPLYGLLDVVSSASAVQNKRELNMYLKAPFNTEETLQFWERNRKVHPTLAKQAAVGMNVPASSGSAGKLFSTAGALQRARRSSLWPETIKQLILVGESVRASSAD